ncbi:hypothetical protein BT69DRAFT_1277296 [Atractiella rhizophila]|nr:hypothetical protein BT69DRAFT_1277296 [Atractiella rhizophila]
MPPTTSINADRTVGNAPGKNSGTLPALPRGRACKRCKERKVRCDAARPICGACRRSAIAQGVDPTTIICQYEERRVLNEAELEQLAHMAQLDSATAEERSLLRLENRLNSLENILRQQGSLLHGLHQNMQSQQLRQQVVPTLGHGATITRMQEEELLSLLLNIPADSQPNSGVSSGDQVGLSDVLGFLRS